MSKDGWFILSVAAMAASLAHVFVDFSIGLYGPSTVEMSLLQAAIILFTCLVYAWWMVSLALAYSSSKAGLVSTFAMVLVWAFLYNGLIAVIVVPPPSAGFPYQDIAHISSMIFGLLAVWRIWKLMPLPRGDAFSWRMTVIGMILMSVALALQSIVTLSNL